jgi:hypothetical protein
MTRGIFFRFAEQGVRQLDGRLHASILPYLWVDEYGKKPRRPEAATVSGRKKTARKRAKQAEAPAPPPHLTSLNANNVSPAPTTRYWLPFSM